MRTRILVLLTLCALAPVPGIAQNSVFGVHGIGYPGRPVSARVRALGGGPGVFDARSAINPASISGLGRLVVTASSATSLRNYTALDSIVTGLSETRFPFALIGTGVAGTPISIALSYSGYAEQSYDLVTFDSVTIRDDIYGVTDRVRSAGAVADIRGAVAWRIVPRLSVGGAVHVLSGLLQLNSDRVFSNSVYFPLHASERVALSGYGLSAGVMLTASQALSIAASVRSDTELSSKVESTVTGRVELPTSYSAGVFLAPHRAIRWSTTVERHLWSAAGPDLEAAGGANAFDTWALGSGVELGGGSGAPLRVGGRYAQLPFSPTAEQATEFVVSAGSALGFAGGRASFEASVERVMRSGANAEERAWHFMFALTVMP
jgi:hypothetical protein